jgi:hypothetical protein
MTGDVHYTRVVGVLTRAIGVACAWRERRPAPPGETGTDGYRPSDICSNLQLCITTAERVQHSLTEEAARIYANLVAHVHDEVVSKEAQRDECGNATDRQRLVKWLAALGALGSIDALPLQLVRECDDTEIGPLLELYRAIQARLHRVTVLLEKGKTELTAVQAAHDERSAARTREMANFYAHQRALTLMPASPFGFADGTQLPLVFATTTPGRLTEDEWAQNVFRALAVYHSSALVADTPAFVDGILGGKYAYSLVAGGFLPVPLYHRYARLENAGPHRVTIETVDVGLVHLECRQPETGRTFDRHPGRAQYITPDVAVCAARWTESISTDWQARHMEWVKTAPPGVQTEIRTKVHDIYIECERRMACTRTAWENQFPWLEPGALQRAVFKEAFVTAMDKIREDSPGAATALRQKFPTHSDTTISTLLEAWQWHEFDRWTSTHDSNVDAMRNAREEAILAEDACETANSEATARQGRVAFLLAAALAAMNTQMDEVNAAEGDRYAMVATCSKTAFDFQTAKSALEMQESDAVAVSAELTALESQQSATATAVEAAHANDGQLQEEYTTKLGVWEAACASPPAKSPFDEQLAAEAVREAFLALRATKEQADAAIEQVTRAEAAVRDLATARAYAETRRHDGAADLEATTQAVASMERHAAADEAQLSVATAAAVTAAEMYDSAVETHAALCAQQDDVLVTVNDSEAQLRAAHARRQAAVDGLRDLADFKATEAQLVLDRDRELNAQADASQSSLAEKRDILVDIDTVHEDECARIESEIAALGVTGEAEATQNKSDADTLTSQLADADAAVASTTKAEAEAAARLVDATTHAEGQRELLETREAARDRAVAAVETLRRAVMAHTAALSELEGRVAASQAALQPVQEQEQLDVERAALAQLGDNAATTKAHKGKVHTATAALKEATAASEEALRAREAGIQTLATDNEAHRAAGGVAQRALQEVVAQHAVHDAAVGAEAECLHHFETAHRAQTDATREHAAAQGAITENQRVTTATENARSVAHTELLDRRSTLACLDAALHRYMWLNWDESAVCQAGVVGLVKTAVAKMFEAGTITVDMFENWHDKLTTYTSGDTPETTIRARRRTWAAFTATLHAAFGAHSRAGELDAALYREQSETVQEIYENEVDYMLANVRPDRATPRDARDAIRRHVSTLLCGAPAELDKAQRDLEHVVKRLLAWNKAVGLTTVENLQRVLHPQHGLWAHSRTREATIQTVLARISSLTLHPPISTGCDVTDEFDEFDWDLDSALPEASGADRPTGVVALDMATELVSRESDEFELECNREAFVLPDCVVMGCTPLNESTPLFQQHTLNDMFLVAPLQLHEPQDRPALDFALWRRVRASSPGILALLQTMEQTPSDGVLQQLILDDRRVSVPPAP